MLGKDHGDLFKEIDGRKDGKNVGIVPILEKGKFPVSNYFIESSCQSGTRQYKCYLITKVVRIIPTLSDNNFVVSDYFIESKYVDDSSKEKMLLIH